MGGIEYKVQIKDNEKVIEESSYITIFGSYIQAIKLVWWTFQTVRKLNDQSKRWNSITLEKQQLG